MMIFMSSQKVNAFQMIMGLFLHSTGCPKRVLRILSSLGLSISYSQVQNVLRSLTKDARERANLAALTNDFFVIYDNINIPNKHHHQRIDKRDTFENGTAATLILFPTDKNQAAPLTLFRPPDERPRPNAMSFFPKSSDLEVLQCVCQSHVSAAIVRSLPEGSAASAIPIKPVSELEGGKTSVFPLQVMRLDESTIAGNLAVVKRIMEVSLQLPKSFFASPKDTIFARDQMTVSRLLTLKVYCSIDSDLYHSLSWVSES